MFRPLPWPILSLVTALLVSLSSAVYAIDHHSFSNPEEIRVHHVMLNLDVDFKQRRLRGSAELSLKFEKPGSTELVLDTRDLAIDAVMQRTAGGWETAPYTLGNATPEFGAPLAVILKPGADAVRVDYATSPDASGLQWLEPAQTAGLKHPFLYSQAQAIHARSFVPLQDSPGVRITYDAVVRVPAGLRAVMSAANDPQAPADGEFSFHMPQPIPAYLLALAVGDLKFKAIGERTGVYAEPALLDAAAEEFSDTQSMLETVENRYGPYAWDRYDLLILPPSFPWGGMENPRLSFITPTVIAGDKSLVSLIAHELAHSWSGNTVTNATWPDIWLNEGFTTYLTYRIMEEVYGTARSDMERVLGYQDLQADIASLPAPDTRLVPDLAGRDPDAAFSDVPYEKGALFVTELEQRTGRAEFDAFLRQYFEHFAFRSISTPEFLDYAQEHLVDKYPDRHSMARFKQWIYEPGIPEGAPQPQSDAFSRVEQQSRAWQAGESPADQLETDDWTVHQWRYFLNNLPGKLTRQQMEELDEAFSFTNTRNNEVAHSWLLVAIRNQYEPAAPRVEEYLVNIGRRKLILPLYEALLETPQGREKADLIYARAKPGYQVVARNSVDKLFAESH